jgi:hypothetical protein
MLRRESLSRMWIDAVVCGLLSVSHVYSQVEKEEKEAYLCGSDSPLIALWPILSMDWREEVELEHVR